MIKVRDGYGKLIGSNYNGNIAHVLLSNGGNLEYAVGSTASTLVLRNASGQIESSVASTVAPFVISSTKVNTNLNADLLDGFLATGLFQSLTSAADKNLYIKIGDTEKEVSLLYASYLGGVTKEGLFTELTNVNDSTNPNSIKVTIGDTTKYLKVAYSDLAGKVVCSASTNNVDRPIVVTNTSNGVYYSTKVTLNYSTGNVTAPTFTGALIGNADTATTASKLSTVSKTAWGLTYWTSGGVPTSISGDMTGVGNITITSGGNVDRFITFDTASTRSWRIGYLGSGSGDANYLAFQSTKTLTAADGWHDMLKIGCETGNAILAGLLTAKNFVSGDGVNDFSAGTVKLDVLNIPTSAGGTTFGPGAAGQVLKTNGTTVYWGDGGSSGGGYWANLPTQLAADATTIPTFGGVIVNGTSILNGLVGIGILNPKAKLTVNVGALSANPTSGLLGTLNTMSVGAAGSYGTYFWTRGSGKGYIQVGREDGTATVYDLILQLLGGNVGIGTENPVQKLDVAGKVKADALYLTRTNGDVAFTIANEASTNGFNISATGGSSYIRFYTNNGGSSAEERMRIHTNGYVGIGTPSPSSLLHVNGDGRITNIHFRGTFINLNRDGATSAIYDSTKTALEIEATTDLSILRTYNVTTQASIVLHKNGCIGIGTLTPSLKLDVVGSIQSSDTVYGRAITAVGNTVGPYLPNINWFDLTRNVGFHVSYRLNETTKPLRFYYKNGDTFTLLVDITSTGNVGIGTTSPLYKLDVINNARVASIVMEVNDEINRYGGALYLLHRGTIAGSLGDARTGNIFMCANGGAVGIGTTSPIHKLQVTGAGVFNNTGSTTYATNGITIGAGDAAERYITCYGKTGSSYINVGYGPGTNNSGEFFFNYVSSGSTSNYSGVGIYGGANYMYLYPDYATFRKPLIMPGELYSGNYAINMSNSDIVGINALYTADNAESGTEGLQFSRGNGYYDSVWASGGVLYFSPNGNLNRSGSYSDNYTVLHSSNWPSYIGDNGYVMRGYTIDATGLDLNTWYPVTMYIGARPNVRIEIRVSLDSGSKPSWSTHTSGFSVRKIWETNGSGWGTNTVHRTVFVSDYAHASADPVRGMGDMGYSSTEYVYVRGGGRYYFYTSHNITPYLRTSTYVGTADPYYLAISPTTTAPGTIAGFLINRSMYASHFYENSDIKLKENINLISSSDNIPLLKEFNWKSDGKHSYGLIAQELEAMGYSELVEDSGDHKTVNYSAALSLIVGKLQVKIKELEKEIEILKNKN